MFTAISLHFGANGTQHKQNEFSSMALSSKGPYTLCTKLKNSLSLYKTDEKVDAVVTKV